MAKSEDSEKKTTVRKKKRQVPRLSSEEIAEALMRARPKPDATWKLEIGSRIEGTIEKDDAVFSVEIKRLDDKED